MRILDQDSDRALSHVTLYLLKREAAELRDTLDSLLARPGGHGHVPDGEYAKEITVVLYGGGHDASLDDRSRRLIEDDD